MGSGHADRVAGFDAECARAAFVDEHGVCELRVVTVAAGLREIGTRQGDIDDDAVDGCLRAGIEAHVRHVGELA